MIFRVKSIARFDSNKSARVFLDKPLHHQLKERKEKLVLTSRGLDTMFRIITYQEVFGNSIILIRPINLPGFDGAYPHEGDEVNISIQLYSPGEIIEEQKTIQRHIIRYTKHPEILKIRIDQPLDLVSSIAGWTALTILGEFTVISNSGQWINLALTPSMNLFTKDITNLLADSKVIFRRPEPKFFGSLDLLPNPPEPTDIQTLREIAIDSINHERGILISEMKRLLKVYKKRTKKDREYLKRTKHSILFKDKSKEELEETLQRLKGKDNKDD